MALLRSIEDDLGGEIDPAFAGRARLIMRRLFEHRPARVLDAGCGRGFYTRVLSRCPFVSHITAMDVTPAHLAATAALTAGHPGVSLVEGSIGNLPFADERFDAIICSEVLEHVPDAAAAVGELHRVLKPGGVLCATVPCRDFPAAWDPVNWVLMRTFGTHVPAHVHWAAGIWADHQRLYTAEEFSAVLASRFAVERVEGVVRWCWPFAHFLLYGIGKNLVDRCGVTGFDRFSSSGTRPAGRALAALMRAPGLLGAPEGPTAVNLFASARKT